MLNARFSELFESKTTEPEQWQAFAKLLTDVEKGLSDVRELREKAEEQYVNEVRNRELSDLEKVVAGMAKCAGERPQKEVMESVARAYAALKDDVKQSLSEVLAPSLAEWEETSVQHVFAFLSTSASSLSKEVREQLLGWCDVVTSVAKVSGF